MKFVCPKCMGRLGRSFCYYQAIMGTCEICGYYGKVNSYEKQPLMPPVKGRMGKSAASNSNILKQRDQGA